MISTTSKFILIGIKCLIEALQIVSLHHSIATAKSLLKGQQLDAFKHTLSELSNLNINPVTIPKRWNIEHIPNLLYIYYRKAKMAEFEWLPEQEIKTYEGICLTLGIYRILQKI